MKIDLSKLTRAQFSAYREKIAPHLQFIIDAVSRGQIAYCIILSNATLSEIPESDRPTVFAIGDDLERAAGPTAFDQTLLDRIAAQVCNVVVVSCEAMISVYRSAAVTAMVRHADIVIVETQPDQESAWVQYFRALRPDIGMLIATVAGPGA